MALQTCNRMSTRVCVWISLYIVPRSFYTLTFGNHDLPTLVIALHLFNLVAYTWIGTYYVQERLRARRKPKTPICAHYVGQGGTLHQHGEWMGVYFCTVCERAFTKNAKVVLFDHAGPYEVRE